MSLILSLGEVYIDFLSLFTSHPTEILIHHDHGPTSFPKMNSKYTLMIILLNLPTLASFS